MVDPGTRALVSGRQAIIDRLKGTVRRRRTELYRRADEQLHGPQGEARSASLVERAELVPLDLIVDDPDFENLRLKAAEDDLRELSESMQHEGLKVPVVLVVAPGTEVRFHVRAGFRRTLAARRLGWNQIPAVILPDDTPVVDGYWTNIIENTARSSLSTYEVAAAARTMRDRFEVSPREFALRAGYSEPYVIGLLRCLDHLPDEIVDEWRRRAPIPLSVYAQWAKLEPREALKAMLVYRGRNLQVVKGWNPSPSAKEKAHPVRMTSARGLLRMQRVRFAVEVARTLDDRTRKLCLSLVDYCSGAREDVPEIYDPRTKQRDYKDRRQNDIDLPAPGEDLPSPPDEDPTRAVDDPRDPDDPKDY